MIAGLTNVICEQPGCGYNVTVVPEDEHEAGKNQRSFSGTCANCGAEYHFRLTMTVTPAKKDEPEPAAEEKAEEKEEEKPRARR